MFDKIIDAIINGWTHIKPFIVVNAYSEALIMRLGKIHRTLSPGLHFKIPFIDESIEYYTVTSTINLPAQSIYLPKSKTNLVVKGLIKYHIEDGEKFFLKAYGVHDALADITQGIIKKVLIALTDEECYTNDIDAIITEYVIEDASEWGIAVEAVTLTDIAPIKSYRFFNEVKTDQTNANNHHQ